MCTFAKLSNKANELNVGTLTIRVWNKWTAYIFFVASINSAFVDYLLSLLYNAKWLYTYAQNYYEKYFCLIFL